MKRSVMNIAASAAALALAVAVGFGIHSLRKAPPIAGDITCDEAILKFMGFLPGTTESVVVQMSAEGNIIGQVKTDGVTISDENGETVDPDSIFLLSTYWLDENGELRFTDIPVGGYLVESDIDGKSYQLSDFNSEDYEDRIIFDPADGYLGSAEDGTAYDTEPGELEVTIEKDGDGKYKFVFTPHDGGKFPFSEITEYHLDAISAFSAAPESLGGSGPSYLSVGVGGEIILDPEKCVIDPAENTITADPGYVRWARIRSIGAELSDGRRLELHGDWVLKIE